MNTKTLNILYWATTIFIFLFEGVMVALTSQTPFAKEAIANLGYPEYFGVYLSIMKVIGSVVLIVPQFSTRLKEWAYAGFGIVFLSAGVSHWAIEGFTGFVVLPMVLMAVLAVSYWSRLKLNKN
jgi:DoxX-like family